MDSILSTVLSAFTHNPIFVLAIIAYIVFSFLKSSKMLMSMKPQVLKRLGRIWSVNTVFLLNVK